MDIRILSYCTQPVVTRQTSMRRSYYELEARTTWQRKRSRTPVDLGHDMLLNFIDRVFEELRKQSESC